MTSKAIRFARFSTRLLCLFAYSLSLFIFYHVQPIAAKAYDDLCAVQGVTYGNGSSVGELLSIFAVLATVTLVARGTTLIIANLIVAGGGHWPSVHCREHSIPVLHDYGHLRGPHFWTCRFWPRSRIGLSALICAPLRRSSSVGR
jgi:hypothetical protein